MPPPTMEFSTPGWESHRLANGPGSWWQLMPLRRRNPRRGIEEETRFRREMAHGIFEQGAALAETLLAPWTTPRAKFRVTN